MGKLFYFACNLATKVMLGKEPDKCGKEPVTLPKDVE